MTKPYINRLQDENAELKEQLRIANERVTELLVYYTSSKFHDDDTAHVRTDVLPKLSELRTLTLQ